MNREEMEWIWTHWQVLWMKTFDKVQITLRTCHLGNFKLRKTWKKNILMFAHTVIKIHYFSSLIFITDLAGIQIP